MLLKVKVTCQIDGCPSLVNLRIPTSTSFSDLRAQIYTSLQLFPEDVVEYRW
jgi:hypothetical protein